MFFLLSPFYSFFLPFSSLSPGAEKRRGAAAGGGTLPPPPTAAAVEPAPRGRRRRRGTSMPSTTTARGRGGSGHDDAGGNLVLHQRILILRQRMAKLARVMAIWPLASYASYFMYLFFLASGTPLFPAVSWFIGICCIIVANTYCLAYLCDEGKVWSFMHTYMSSSFVMHLTHFHMYCLLRV